MWDYDDFISAEMDRLISQGWDPADAENEAFIAAAERGLDREI